MFSVLVVVAIVLVGLIAGIDFFCAVVLRAAARTFDNSEIVRFMGTIHQFGDRRLMWPALASVLAAVGAATFAIIEDADGLVVGSSVVAAAAALLWLGVFMRVSAPVNAALSAAARGGPAADRPRAQQDRWDSVIALRAFLLVAALSLLGVAAVTN